MNAVILAGGFGSRLKPLTDAVPKPMVNIANIPMLDYTVSHLYAFGLKNYVFTLGYYPKQITDFVKGYRDITARFSIENVPLGTAGGVKEAENLLDDLFIVVSGDALENIDFAAMLHKHLTSNADITMAVTEVENPSLYGVVELDGYGTVIGFCEKPAPQQCRGSLVNCGVYIMNKTVLNWIPSHEKFDFSRDLFPSVLRMGKISAYIHNGYWSDIGDIRSYYLSNFHMMNGGFFPRLYHYRAQQFESTMVGIRYPSLLGASASFVGDCRNSIIGHGARVASGASVDNCVVLDGVVVRGRYLNSVVGEGWAITVPTAVTARYPFNSLQNLQNFY